MDAVEYFKELERLSWDDNDSYNKLGFITEIEDRVKFVEEWSKTHPRKTRLQDFLEKFPNAKINEHGFPKDTCCMCVGYCESCDKPYHNESDCYFCWKEPLEE